MAITLFPHNERAYRAAEQMLRESGKAAVIHPTGTGKSYIAFKLCEEHPEAKVCWLSPSEYIFKTQQEGLTASGVETPGNIMFLTYARLMLLSDAGLTALRSDYIVLDEFHRCGAEQWGKGVRRLLEALPDASVLGLSATNIRYLDNRRDMADELFDGNVASEMTLGEAIARGILAPPRYVLSVYSYQKALETYRKRAARAKSAAVRDAAESLIERMRRSLEQAEGLEAMFRRHMTNPHGKYLVFCANAEHMDKMIARVPEWFGFADREPHVYRAYSDDPETSRNFAAFKADVSGHLRLLFCIDMLNEGVHVEDVSGVILFRPTVSPIVYKQQIGRALSVGKRGVPVIFDIVNNIENLYSVGAVERELREAVIYCRKNGEAVRCEQFEIIDELRDCRELFETLNETLTASWDMMYGYAKAYYEAHGELNVPKRYKTPEGYSLGSWLATQRKVYRGEQPGVLDEARVRKLDAIGMEWDGSSAAAWRQYYAALRAYRKEHGDLDIPASYVGPEGLRLGGFVSNLRTAKSLGQRSAYLTPDRIQALDALGMIWDRLDYQWEKNYLACAGYYLEHRNLDIPNGYVTAEGLRIGAWIRRQRMVRDGRVAGRLSAEQIKRLDAIGMEWCDAYTRQWEYGYEQAKKYFEQHGDLDVPATYVNEAGFPLGKWLRRHREVSAKTGKSVIRITPERKAKLDALGMVWEKPRDPWEVRYALANAYYAEHGDLRVPNDYRPEGIWLGKWLNEQKQIYHGRRLGKQLSMDQVKRLNEIKINWTIGARPAMSSPAMRQEAR